MEEPLIFLAVISLGSQGLNLIVGSSESEIESHLRWLFDKFAAFSLFLGMLVKGFEKEILALLRKMEDRQRKKAPVSRKRCKRVMSSSTERELRKLENSMNYERSSRKPKKVGSKEWDLVTVI